MSRLFSVHKNTIRSWLKQGLEAIDGQRPIVARGDEIRRFLSERRVRAKPAFRSRSHLLLAVSRAECVRREDGRMRCTPSDTTGRLQGICPDCDRMIYRRVNPQWLDAVRGDLACHGHPSGSHA